MNEDYETSDIELWIKYINSTNNRETRWNKVSYFRPNLGYYYNSNIDKLLDTDWDDNTDNNIGSNKNTSFYYYSNNELKIDFIQWCKY